MVLTLIPFQLLEISNSAQLLYPKPEKSKEQPNEKVTFPLTRSRSGRISKQRALFSLRHPVAHSHLCENVLAVFPDFSPVQLVCSNHPICPQNCVYFPHHCIKTHPFSLEKGALDGIQATGRYAVAAWRFSEMT